MASSLITMYERDTSDTAGMSHGDFNFEHADPRVLMLSRRRGPIERWRCSGWEFEDVILDVDDVETIAPDPSFRSQATDQPLRWLARHFPAVRHVQSPWRRTPSRKKYPLAFAEVGYTGELIGLGPRRQWRPRCDVAVCYVEELMLKYFPWLRNQLSILDDFDLVLCGCALTVDALSDRLKTEVRFLPSGVDTDLFRPSLPFDRRSIAVTSIGRRSPVTHSALVQHARDTGAFYYFDSATAPTIWVNEPANHRLLLARLITNSRYFISNRALFDRPDKAENQEEVGFRFIEGVAGGAVILGEPPHTDIYKELLGWEDAVIPVPVNCPDIGQVIADLDQQPQRLEAISRRNVINAVRQHDWAYRWKDVLDAVGLPPTPKLTQRIERLRTIADDLENAAQGEKKRSTV